MAELEHRLEEEESAFSEQTEVAERAKPRKVVEFQFEKAQVSWIVVLKHCCSGRIMEGLAKVSVQAVEVWECEARVVPRYLD